MYEIEGTLQDAQAPFEFPMRIHSDSEPHRHAMALEQKILLNLFLAYVIETKMRDGGK